MNYYTPLGLSNILRRGTVCDWMKVISSHEHYFLQKLFYTTYLKTKKRFQEGKINYCGKPLYYTDRPSLLSEWDIIFIKKKYDMGELDHVPCIYDLGANLGLGCIYWLKRYPGCRITAFEPDRIIYQKLLMNLKPWIKESDVNLIEAAVSNTEGTTLFYSEGADGGSISLDTEQTRNNSYPVKTVKLSDFLAKENIIDLLKVDVEGEESVIMDDIENYFEKIDRLFVELHSFEKQPQVYGKIINQLQRAGFRCYPEVINQWESPLNGVIPSYNRMDINIHLYCLKEKVIRKV